MKPTGRCSPSHTSVPYKGFFNMLDLKKIVVLAAAAIAVATLSACNTVEGAGQDIKSAGKAIENTADDAKPSNN